MVAETAVMPGPLARGFAFTVDGINIPTPVQQQGHHLRVSAQANIFHLGIPFSYGFMQGSAAFPIPGVHVRACIQEQG